MNFWDKLGRLHTKPVTEDNPYPTNNAYIYTGYMKVLRPIFNGSYSTYPCYLPEKMPFHRHPDAPAPPISHDELHGVCILSKTKAQEICEYLSNNHNQFCDLPSFVSKSFLALNWYKVYKAFKELNKQANPRTATINYPDTWNIAFWQQPQYRWMYKRAAGISPSLWEKAWFLVVRGISAFRWKKEEPNLLLFFSLKYLKQQDNLGIEGQLVQLYLNRIVGDMYEDINDMLKYATDDLPAKYYSEHPWIKG